MNQKTAYEQIITGKLQALPVPDMADAIWTRIEAQLDLDMPPTDPPPTSPPRTPSGGTILGGISLVFVIALITFLLFKKESDKQPTILQPSNTTSTIQKQKETFSPPNMETGSNGEKAALPPTTAVLPRVLSDSSAVSVLPSPVIINNDSTTGALPIAIAPPVTIPQKGDTLVPVKKGRGVAGLKDEDYRVVPKKDSANNN